MRTAAVLGLIVAIGLQGGPALAFGTVAGFKGDGSLGRQNAEHERITRRALGCDESGPCVAPHTLDMIAGQWSKKPLKFGAVGAPDRSIRFFQSPPHCDNADRLGSDYPVLNREGDTPEAALRACRDLAAKKLEEAVKDAGPILDSKGRLRPFQTSGNCVFIFGVPGRAKCNALEAFGMVLHISQDFYSHSNWTDRADPTKPESASNPPGMNQSGPAPWMSLRGDPREPPPPALLTGCFALKEVAGCSYGPSGQQRVRVIHEILSKDTGDIDPVIGVGTTPRGMIEGNFRRAVEAAIADSRDKWALFEERLIARYGETRGKLIACALRSDDAGRDCGPGSST